MAPTRTDVPIIATRVVVRSSTNYDTALARIKSSIGTSINAQDWRTVVTEAYAATDKETKFTEGVSRFIGPHDLMQFFELNHGAWLPLYSPATATKADGSPRKSVRIVLGNPLIAITMLRHDVDAGLHVPVELLVVEEDEGTKVVYQLPSGLIAGFEGAGEELRKAAERLDGKLETFVRYVLEE
jgi:uncharacterized protein (DUF302 family)